MADAAPPPRPPKKTISAGAWQEATCPVCLMLGVIGPVFPIAREEHAGEHLGGPADQETIAPE